MKPGLRILTFSSPKNPAGNTQFGVNQMKMFPEYSIRTGEIGTFYGNLYPTTAGTWSFQWQMRKSVGPDFGELTPNVPVNCTTDPDAGISISTSLDWLNPSTLPGTQFTATVTVTNTGGQPWTSSGHYLGSALPDLNKRWGVNILKFPSGVTIPQGGSYTFTFFVTAPLIEEGYLDFAWRMRKSGVGGFGVVGNKKIAVYNRLYGYCEDQTVPSTMVAGQQYPVSVTFHNNGTITWVRSQHYLFSENPTGTSRWGIKAITLPTGVTVPPGGSYTFNFTVTAPSTPGTYGFCWRMRKSGEGGFGEPSPNVTVTVQ